MRKMLIVKNIVLKNRPIKRICMYTKFSSYCQLSIQSVLNIQLHKCDLIFEVQLDYADSISEDSY